MASNSGTVTGGQGSSGGEFNFGAGDGYAGGEGINLASGGTIANSGTIFGGGGGSGSYDTGFGGYTGGGGGGAGVNLVSGGTLTNTGAIAGGAGGDNRGVGGAGVELASGGTVTNQATIIGGRGGNGMFGGNRYGGSSGGAGVDHELPGIRPSDDLHIGCPQDCHRADQGTDPGRVRSAARPLRQSPLRKPGTPDNRHVGRKQSGPESGAGFDWTSKISRCPRRRERSRDPFDRLVIGQPWLLRAVVGPRLEPGSAVA